MAADPSPLRVLVGGGSGLIGRELQQQLRAAGHTVLTLVRRPPTADDEVAWAPESKLLDFRVLDGVDAVVSLSGASLSRIPWTPAYRRRILRSRVTATETLAEAMAATASPPAVFLSGSASGFYGDRPGEALTEAAPRGAGFLANVVEAWEAATHSAPDATRVVHLRTSVVLSPTGGALQPLKLATRLGGAAGVGTGRQHWPWISLHDEAAAIVHLLTSEVAGPVNLAAPEAATADDVTRGLARALHRPHLLRIPEALVARIGFGRETLLPSQRLVPEKLLTDGFVFRHPTLEQAIAAAVA